MIDYYFYAGSCANDTKRFDGIITSTNGNPLDAMKELRKFIVETYNTDDYRILTFNFLNSKP